MKDIHHQTIYTTELTHWWYKVRRKIIDDLLKKHFANKSNIKILDIGCGTGALMKQIEPYGSVTGIDVSSQAVAFCKSRGISNVRLGDATSISEKDNTFDLVVALDVLEHVQDDRKVLSEMLRVLKPGGKLIVFVPAYMILWGVTDMLSEHYRRYTRSELKNKASDAGIAIIKASYFNTFLFMPIAFFRVTVRLFHIPVKSENKIGSMFMHKFFYSIFYTEAKLLNRISFPFGVSCMLVGEKTI